LQQIKITGVDVCILDGATIPSYKSVQDFFESSVPFGHACKMEERYCVDGNLSGSAQFSSCGVGVPKDCLFNGGVVKNGDSINAFAASAVAAGKACVASSRLCINGDLSGVGEFSSCVVEQPPAPPPPPTTTTATATTTTPTTTSTTTSATPLLYNFGASDRLTCEANIFSRLGLKASCNIGAGCGSSCGIPNGSTCLSANPSVWGACIDPKNPPPAPPEVTLAPLYNFVAADRLTCEQNILSRLGLKASCKIGGGCGINCSIPNGSTCLSANPSFWGACIDPKNPPPVPVTYNFVSSTKTNCESSVKTKLGLTVQCKVGGGCGISCGIPNGSTCLSANPSLWGACVAQ
jgi:hypothetical protein